MYRAQLLLSQQTQLEQAKRNSTALPRSTSASAVAAAAAVASVPTPSATPQAHEGEGEGSMPPPTRTLSLNSTPVVKELALGPSPGAAAAAPSAGASPATAMAKRRRESLGASVSEARESKKVRSLLSSPFSSSSSPDMSPPPQRATQADDVDDGQVEARNGALGSESAVEANDDLVLVHDFAVLPSATKESAPVVSADDFIAVDSTDALHGANAAGFDAKELLFDPSTRPVDDLAGQFSLEQVRPLSRRSCSRELRRH